MAETNDKPPPVPWSLLAFVGIGIACVFLAILVARRNDLGRKLQLDATGERAPGSAEFDPNGICHIRYNHPDGAIYRTRYEGGFGFQRVHGASFEITVSYSPDKPTMFQPAGVSYLPGAASLTLFAVGMVSVLNARRAIVRAHRRRPPADGEGLE